MRWPLVRVAGERRPEWPLRAQTIRELCQEIGRLNDVIAELNAENARLVFQVNALAVIAEEHAPHS